MPIFLDRFYSIRCTLFLASLVISGIDRSNCTQCAAADQRLTHFEQLVRPLFLDRCISCHGGRQPEGGLSLESAEGWKRSAVVQIGLPDQSALIARVRTTDSELQMPPAESGLDRLNEKQIRDLEQWIADGAVDPRSDSPILGPQRRQKQFQITQQDLDHWAFQPLPNSPTTYRNNPDQQEPAWKIVDRLIEDKLSSISLTRNPPAEPRELVRRAYFDLWGLPPEPTVVTEFVEDPSDQAWQALIDRLLESHHYGERWGRYWLDWVRYAETNGYERDGLKPNAWRYRDYVIRSFHQDKPYDQFLTEQLAGDFLIRDFQQGSIESTSDEWRDAIIATGFFRLHVWDDEPDSSDAAEMDDLDDIMVTTGAAVMGLTLGCARCHDHKFDPISQVDYYAMVDLLRDIDPYGLSKKGGGGRGTGKIERFLASQSEIEMWHNERTTQIAALTAQLDQAADQPQQESLKQRIQHLQDQQPPFEKALSIDAPSGEPKPTYILLRGDHRSPGNRVQASVPQIFSALNWTASTSDSASPATSEFGIRNRLDWARWLTTVAHPLTARVLANRLWLGHFGAGIVPTPDDFGYTGEGCNHPELLDFLAAELVHNNWSIKSLHRSIMFSESYRSASKIRTNSAAPDPDNRFFGRQNLRRLDAESIRDSLLSYAGILSDKRGGPSVYSTLSAEIRDTANPVSLASWSTSPETQQNCRSVFLVVKRSLREPLLEAFDFANSHSPVGRRNITTVAPQALMMLNDQFIHRQAERLASRVVAGSESRQECANRLWQIVLQRIPQSNELLMINEFLDSLKIAGHNRQESWTALARILINSNESIYVD